MGIYALVVGLVFQSIVLIVRQRGWEEVAQEGGYVEIFQTILIAISAVALSFLAKGSALLRPVYVILACLAFGALFREFNNTSWYRTLLPPTLKSIVGLALIAFLIHKFRLRIIPATKVFLTRPSAALYMLGFAIVTLWAQALAQKELWPLRYDRLLEESLELAGYCLIFFAICESSFEDSRIHRLRESKDVGLNDENDGDAEALKPRTRTGATDTHLFPKQ